MKTLSEQQENIIKEISNLTALRARLASLKSNHLAIVSLLDETQLDVSADYPFHASFDEINLTDWIKSVNKNIETAISWRERQRTQTHYMLLLEKFESTHTDDLYDLENLQIAMQMYISRLSVRIETDRNEKCSG